MKYFTVEEANKMLPLVRKIVEDILLTGESIREFVGINPHDIENNPDFQIMNRILFDYIDELSDLGCHYKDWNFKTGLVDFPAIINDREVLLCWKSDESEIKYYHDIEAGFSGRMRL